MAKFNRFHRARLFTFDEKAPEVILDFDDDWHYAIKLTSGMKKEEVARVLELAARDIYSRANTEPKS